MSKADWYFVLFRSDSGQFLSALEFFSDKIEWTDDLSKAMQMDRYDTVEAIGREALNRLSDPSNSKSLLKYAVVTFEDGIRHMGDLKSISIGRS